MATTTDNKTIYVDLTIGVIVILIGAIVYTGRILYKKRKRRRRRRKDSESVLESIIEMEQMNTESPPKKTAADHLGELKEVTQKVLQPLRKSSSFSSPRENLSTVLSSERSSVSLKNNTKRDNKIFTLEDSLMIKPFKVPPPPPPSPLRNDDIKVEPIRLSLLNLLLTNESTNTSSSISSPIIDSSSDLSFPTGTNSKNDSLHSLQKTLSKSQPDFNNLSRTTTIPKETNLKVDSLRKTLSKSQTDLKNSLQTTTLSRETNSKKNLLRKSISKSQPDLKDLSRQKLPQLDLTVPPKLHSKKGPLSQLDLTPSSRTISQLNLAVPSETLYKWDLTRITPTSPKLDSKVQSKRSNRQTYSRNNKETNDYSNFQPIQNMKPVQNVQNAQPEKTGKITKIVETDEVEELTLFPMYRIVKPVLKKERQDDEIILDATLE